MPRPLIPATLALVGITPLTLAQQPPTITSVGGAFSAAPTDLVIQGTDLASTSAVSVGGLAATIVQVSDVQVTVSLPPVDPGVADVTLTTAFGTASAPQSAQLWPLLSSGQALQGFGVELSLVTGNRGQAFVYASPNELASPLTIPGINFGLALDPGALLTVVDGEAVPGGQLDVVVPAPPTPALAGKTLFFQAWVFKPTGVNSFSTVASGDFPLDQAIVGCSLGCSGGLDLQSCGTTSLSPVEPIEIDFALPVDPTTVGLASFELRDASGAPAAGTFDVTGAASTRVRFQPALAYGPTGNFAFGLQPGTPYTLLVRGTAASSGPYISSTSGQSNRTTLTCDLTPTTLVEQTPGPVLSEVFVEQFENGQLVATTPIGQSDGALVDSTLRFEFDDLLLGGSVLAGIRVELDVDGDLQTDSDRVPIAGAFELSVNDQITTSVRFVPDEPLPSAGFDAAAPRRILVFQDGPNAPSGGLADVGGQPYAGLELQTFTTEFATPGLTVLPLGGEDFDDDEALDLERSAVLLDGLGQTAFTLHGGGSGELGELFVQSGQKLTLSTGPIPTVFGPELATGPVLDLEGQVIAYHVQSEIIDRGSYPADWATNGVPDDGPGESTTAITDGVFRFSRLEVEGGGVVELVGENPARLFVRGDAVIEGLVLAEGDDADPLHDSLGEFAFTDPVTGPVPGPDTNGNGVADGFGGFGAAGNLGSGAGGSGGSRLLASGLVGLGNPSTSFLQTPEGAFPWGSPGFVPLPGNDLDGDPGQGRGGAVGGSDDEGAGSPGLRHPPIFPGELTGQVDDLGGLILNSFCESVQFAAGGAGGSFAAPGTSPTYSIPPGLAAIGGVDEPALPVGSTSVLTASSALLDPALGGNLLGGAGGGGGGTGAAFTRTSGLPFNCSVPNPGIGGGVLQLFRFVDGSGAGGGSGGGALQVQVGNALELSGALSVRGGDGGGFDGFANPLRAATAPGGGGSGGSLLVQARSFDLSGALAGTFDVEGGRGGINANTLSTGGDGGPGVVQAQNLSSFAAQPAPLDQFAEPPLDAAALGAATVPPLDPQTVASQPGGPFRLDDVLATGGWEPVFGGPGASTGLVSCWFGTGDNDLAIADDDPVTGELGWDFALRLEAFGGGTISLRGDPGVLAPLTGGLSVQETVGNELGSSSIVVRFQAVRVEQPVALACDLDSLLGQVVPDTRTPWLRTPQEALGYFDLLFADDPLQAFEKRPNLLRYTFVLDRSNGSGAIFSGLESVEFKTP